MTGRVRATAPVRVLDAGGWTDTWFAATGVVCHLAVEPGVEVIVAPDPAGDGRAAVDLRVESFGERYRFDPAAGPGRHPLLEAIVRRWAPREGPISVTVASAVPPGSGLGTSASVAVALTGALAAASGRPLTAAETAGEAHRIETEDLGLQSGVQDQLAAAHGGANLILVDPYPRAEVIPLELAAATWESLERRLVTVYLGSPHRSSSIHRAVIDRIGGHDPRGLLEPLRSAARRAAAALVDGDLGAYGQAMSENTEGQAALHPGLVGGAARRVMEVARAHRAAGWKVNGAGGDGGSVTIVGPDDPLPLVADLEAVPGLTVLPLAPARRGVVVHREG